MSDENKFVVNEDVDDANDEKLGGFKQPYPKRSSLKKDMSRAEELDTVGESQAFKPRDTEFRSMSKNQPSRRQEIDDVRCMFSMAHNIPRPVLQQDAGLQESTIVPRSADQLLLDLQQLGLVRDKGGVGAESVPDGRIDQEPILKDLKQIQYNPMERPVFHCFLRELCIDKRLGTYLVTVEQAEDAFVMVAYQEPSEGQATMRGTELARFPKFPQITDGFCLSASGDSVVFTCTLLGCVVYASLSSCAMDADPSGAAVAATAAVGAGQDAAELKGSMTAVIADSHRRSSVIGRRDNISHDSSQSSLEAGVADHAFNFLPNRVVLVAEANYRLSEPISEHVYDVCIREMSNIAGSGTNKCNLYVTNKSNIAVVNLSGLKLDNFLFEGLRLPWRLKLYKHLLIIAEKWGSVQVADLDKEHRSLCVTDMQDLSCQNGLKSIEVVPEHNLLLLTVYPEGNQTAGQHPEDSGTTARGEASASGGASTHESRIGGTGVGRLFVPGSHRVSDNEEGSWSCHCFHFNPESTHHGNSMLRYAQTLSLSRSPLSTIYSDVTKRLYVLCFHPARNNSALLLMRLEVFHEERGRTAKFTARQLLPQKDEEEYKTAVDGLAGRRLGNEPSKMVEMLDLTGSPVVALMKAPINLGFK